MEDDPEITILEDFDTAMLQQEGWKLYKMLQDSLANAHTVYMKAVDLMEKEKAADGCEIGLRPVTHNDSVFMEIYKKSK